MDNPDHQSPGTASRTMCRKFPLLVTDFFNDPVCRIQIVKFCFVGVLNTIVGYGAFFILVNYYYYLLALLIAHLIGVIHSFFWNKYWIFGTRSINLGEFLKFNVIYIIVFIVNAAALFISVDIVSLNPRLAQLILLPVITVISFFGQKLWTFRVKA